MIMKTSKQAVTYLRVSGLGQVEGDGLRRQREAVADRANALSLQIVDEFVDAGVGGTTPLYDRPGLTALVERVAANGVRTVLVERADRLARDLIEGELILRELRLLGVTVVEAEAGTDLTVSGNPTAQLVRQILGAVAEFEKSAMVAKLRVARERKRIEAGRCEGPPPFGTIEGEAEALKALLRLARKRNGKRLSAAAIALELDRMGHKPRRGATWSRSSVRAVLLRRGK